MKAKIRKLAVNVEETHLEIGRKVDPITRKAVAVAVIENPFANSNRQADARWDRGNGTASHLHHQPV